MSTARRKAEPVVNTITLDGRDLSGDWYDTEGREYYVGVAWHGYVIVCYRQRNSIQPWPFLVTDGDFGPGRRFQRKTKHGESQ